jgi:hypothetical protein
MKRNGFTKILSLVAIVLSIIACSSLPFVGLTPSGSATSQVAADIPYCDANSSMLCLISFGIDNKGQMFINFYKPDHSIKNFYLKVHYDQAENVYECEAVKGFTKYISCTGKQIPLEEQIDIEVYLSKDDALIARGTFVIYALAIATPVVVTMTVTEDVSDLTSVPATRTPTLRATSTPITPIVGTSSITRTPTSTNAAP